MTQKKVRELRTARDIFERASEHPAATFADPVSGYISTEQGTASVVPQDFELDDHEKEGILLRLIKIGIVPVIFFTLLIILFNVAINV